MPSTIPTISRVTQVALYVATFATGLFTGLLWTFMVSVDRAEETLNASDYAAWRQELIVATDRGIWPVLLLSALAPLVVLVALRRHRRSGVFRWVLVGFVVWILFVNVYTVVLNVPINNEMMTWDPANPPADWADARDRWDLLNTIRTPFAFFVFLAYLRAMQLMGRAETAAKAPVAKEAAAGAAA
jgi:uncharacterized membrane protein